MSTPVLVVGAGPAGMAAAVRLRQAHHDVVVVDDAPAPGGQVWRAAERSTGTLARALGTDYGRGKAAIAAFRASGAIFQPKTELWRLDEGWRAYTKHDGAIGRIDAHAVLLATGALERPVPFPGWTLPGVVTVGGAQTLLKNAGQIPERGVWIAGSGPLVLLYAAQILALGGRIEGWLNTAPRGSVLAGTRVAIRHAGHLLGCLPDLAKGLRWRVRLAIARMPVIPIEAIAAEGDGRLEVIRCTMRGGRTVEWPARLLLVHEGVVPNIHATLALGCAHDWSEQQHAFTPRLDAFSMTSRERLYVAGDGGGILGARAAVTTGTLAAIGILLRAGSLSPEAASREAASLRQTLARERGLRAFLDALYRPRPEVLAPRGDTIVCRCEEVTAGEIRRSSDVSGSGPNQIKAFTRAGMGPCQGRQCGLTVARIISEVSGRHMMEVGHQNVRPPLKPVTVAEMARAAELDAGG